MSINPLQSGASLHVCMAIEKNHGVLFYTSQYSAFTGDDFSCFLVNLCEEIVQKNLDNVCLLFDNASIHRDEDILRITDYYNILYLFNIPYSPMLNIMEECISVIKSKIKKKLSIDYRSTMMMISSSVYGSRSLLRRNLLIKVLDESVQEINSGLIINLYNHWIGILGKCLQMQDL